VWQVLPTQHVGNRLVSRVDDARFSAGVYDLRATALDRAANENSTSQRLDGAPMVLALPLRLPTVLRAGAVVKSRTRRHKPLLVPRARARFGRQVKLAGRLQTRVGHPISGAEIQILERSSTTPEHLLATLTTDERGRWLYLARARSTSVLRVVHVGSATTLPSQRDIRLLVPAASSIRAQPRRLRNGQAVTFQGRLQSRPVPAAGKLIELQVVLSHRWQTFQTVRSNSTGAWTARYRFRRSCGLTRYRFRARLPTEADYPFETGRTRPVVVRVRGRACQ
jgi:hypothetical protein